MNQTEENRKRELGEEAKRLAAEAVRSPRTFLRYLNQQAWLPEHSPYNIFLLMKKRNEVRRLLSEEEILAQGIAAPEDAEWITFVIARQLPPGTDGVSYFLQRFQDAETLGLPLPQAPDANRWPRDLLVKLIAGCGIRPQTVERLPNGEYGACYDNQEKRLLIPEDQRDPELLFQRVAIQLAMARFSQKVTPFSRKKLSYPALCAAYLVCRRYGVETEDLSVHRITPALAGMDEKHLQETLVLIHDAFQYLDGILSA